MHSPSVSGSWIAMPTCSLFLLVNIIPIAIDVAPCTFSRHILQTSQCFLNYNAHLFIFTVKHLEHWMKDLRTQFSKLSALGKSGDGSKVLSDRKKWILKSCEFLRKHIKPRRQCASSKQVFIKKIYVHFTIISRLG